MSIGRMGRIRTAGVVLAAVAAVVLASLGFSGVAQAAAPPDPNTVGETTFSHIELNGVLGTERTVAPGEDVKIGANWEDHNTTCAGCIDYVATGFAGKSPAGCIEFNGGRESGFGEVDLGPAPTKGGTFDIVAQFEETLTCGEGWNASESTGYPVIAKVTVPTTTAPPDLLLENKASPSPVVSGNTLTYTITVTNTGGESANNVTLADQLPESAVFGSFSTTQGECVRKTGPRGTPKPKDGAVLCKLGSLEGGKTATITVTVTPTKPGTVKAKAVVKASNVASDANDEETATTTVLGD
jgi:uncharacterized repeat protein (TIGR01451 family)